MTGSLLALFTAATAAPATDAKDRTASTPSNAAPVAEAARPAGSGAPVVLGDAPDAARRVAAYPLVGQYTRDDSLRRLLNGFAGPSASPLSKFFAQTQLEEIVVSGRQARGGLGDPQRPNGPGVGVVATNSAIGTKTNTPLIETPQSISVVTQEQISLQKPQTVAEAFRYSAGVVPEPFGVATHYTDFYVYLRGFRIDVFRDGLKETAFNSFDPYFLERAEIIHGSASVLYGQASPAGIQDLVSKRPTLEPIHEVGTIVGNFGRVRGQFDVGGPVDKEGHWLYRVTGIADEYKGQPAFTDIRRFAIAPALTWTPDASTYFTILSNYTNDPALGPYAGLPSQGTVLPNPFGNISRTFFAGDPNYNLFKREQASIGYAAEHRLNDNFAVRQNLRFQNNAATENHLYGNGFSTPSALAPDDRTLSRFLFNDLNRRQALNLDTQAQADFNTGPIRHTALYGVDYQHIVLNEKSATDFSAPKIDVFNPIYYQPFTVPIAGQANPANPLLIPLNTMTHQDQIGLYAQDQARLGGFSFLGSVRQDKLLNDVDNFLTPTLGSSQEYNATSYRLGLLYKFDNGVAPYGSYATSFQPPTAATSFQGTAFKPTTGQQAEVGVKYQPFINTLITFAAYDLTQQNVLTPDPVNVGFSVQQGEVRSKGLEFEARSNVTENFRLIASGSYSDTRVTQSTTMANIGKHPVQIPNSTAAFFVDYTFHGGAFSGLGLGGGVRYIGQSYGTASNLWGVGPDFINTPSRVPGFTLFDAVVRYDWNANWHFQFNVANLFDTRFVSSCVSAFTCYYGAPRILTASARYTW